MIYDIRSLDLDDRTVLTRCDFNVPISAGAITDPTRIDASLGTIRYILGHGGRAVLCSHLGRPENVSPEFSLKPVAAYLRSALRMSVAFAPDCIGSEALELVTSLPRGGVLLLENLRFHPGEEANDPQFAQELVRGMQVYVNDAFGSAHRAHASTEGVTRYLSERAAGFLMTRELNALRALAENPARPYVAILGGSKVKDKIRLIRNLLTKVDVLMIGGAMAYTFLKALGHGVGISRIEEDMVALAAELLSEASRSRVRLLLPTDHVSAKIPEDGLGSHVVTSIPDGEMALDIGPATVERFIDQLSGAKTIVWNGPLGRCETPAFAQGTLRVGEAVAKSRAHSVLGGGDTVSALAHRAWSNGFSHISTGGGATIEFLEGRDLPGVKALER